MKSVLLTKIGNPRIIKKDYLCVEKSKKWLKMAVFVAVYHNEYVTMVTFLEHLTANQPVVWILTKIWVQTINLI